MAKIKKGDLVEVIAGKDKGRRGKVLKIYSKGNKVLVQGINIVKKHMKQRRQDTPGGIIEMEAALNYSNILLVCNRCGRGVKTGYKILADGTKVRICKSCGETV